jgi:hypothetical protein
MNKLDEEFRNADQALTIIEGLARCIAIDPFGGNANISRARHIQRKIRELRKRLRDVFKIDTDRNVHIGAVREMLTCEEVGQETGHEIWERNSKL